MRHAVIMAGGAGVRLWPLSRRNRPKQTLRVFDGKSLLRHSYERIAGLLAPEQIHVIATEDNLPVVSAEIPELLPANLIGEPVRRDTANAVGLAAAVLHEQDKDAVIGVFTADHLISPTDTFHECVSRAFEMAEQHADALVTLGVRPTRADTNYGYIKRGERLAPGVYQVRKFAEKPSMGAAMKWVASGEYYWNSGMFAWRASTILKQLAKHLPPSHAAMLEIAAAWRTPHRQERLAALYPCLMRISIDFAVMERAEKLIMVELNCHWVDVGSWPAIESVIQADPEGNVTAASHAMHLGSRGNVVVSADDHLIATIGVDDLVIVHSPDATLICTKRDSLGIKELVDNVSEKYGEKYL
jgi:mannose-1-phosphate guanylyltransferase